MAPRSIPELLRRVRTAHPDEIGFRHKREGRWHDLTWTEAEQSCRRISRALLALGVRPGDRVAILSQTRLEWVECDLGIAGCGAVTVGIYPTSIASDCAYILEHSGSVVAFVEDADQLAKLTPSRGRLPALKRIVLLDGDAVPSEGILAWREFQDLASSVSEADLDARQASIRSEDLASIVYTSGTTGVPKGAMLTHGSLLFVADSAARALGITPGGVYLLFLPLAHVFARLTVHLCLQTANTIGFAESLTKVGDNLKEVRPNFIAGVPRVYEKVQGTILAEVRRAGGIREKIFHWALGVGRRASALEQQGRRLPPWLALERRVARAAVFRKIERNLGGRIEFLISGAAPLDRGVAEFFHACGILILEGIGMTENSSFSHVNRRERFRFGTVGLVGDGIEARVAPDGEVLIRGPNVMQGYFRDPAATAAAIDPEGWLHTGDVGEIDPDGFLRITDRKKDIIVTSGGKNVSPLKVEQALKASPYVGNAVAFGDRRRFISALVTLDAERIRAWAGANGKAAASLEALSRDPDVLALLQNEVDVANARLASFETVKKFRILPAELSIEAGEMTPTLKVRRRFVAEKYRGLVEEMYGEERPVSGRGP